MKMKIMLTLKPKLILAAYLGLVAGLLLAVALVSSPASLAAWPPIGTPQVVKSSYSFPQDLSGQPASQSVGAVQRRLDSPLSLPSTMRPAAITINSGSGWQKIVGQGFEGTFPPSGWELFDSSSTDGGQYYWGKRNCKPHFGSSSVWAGGGGSSGGGLACTQTYVNNLSTWLDYGPFNLSQATDAELQFDLWADIEGDGPNTIDSFAWGASIDRSSYYPMYATAGQTGDWIPLHLDLTAVPGLGNLTGRPEVYVGWLFNSNGSIAKQGAFVDDVALWVYTPPPPTPTPPPVTLPITRHTTLADFASGRSHDRTVVGVQQGNGALTLAAQTGTMGAWERLPSLRRELVQFRAVTAKGRLFVIGGNAAGDGFQSQVYSALILENGWLGRWDDEPQLPQTLRGHTAVVSNDHLFVLGGSNANGIQKLVFSAPISDDGRLGQWQPLGNLLEPVWFHEAVSARGYIYVLGGERADGSVSDAIYRARVDATGDLSAWEILTRTLPLPSRWHTAVAACDRLYLLGGNDGTFNRSHVFQAEIQPDGNLGEWSETMPLPTHLVGHAATAVRGGILVTGGWRSFDPVFNSQRKVYWAPLDSTCSLSNWVELTSLPYATDTHALAATDRYVYNLGGINAAGRAFASVLMAPIQSSSNPASQGSFNHQFYLGSNYIVEALHWIEEGSGDTAISLRYRVASAGTGECGPWSNYFSANPIPINALSGYVEYEFKFKGGSSPSNKYVSEVSLTITPPRSVYLPLVVK